MHAGFAEKTVKHHVANLDLFATFLLSYDPLKRLDAADRGDVWMFFVDWFPRKASWASKSSVTSNITSFKKFFQWLGETGRVAPEIVTEVLTTLKEERDTFLANVDE